MPPDAPTNQTPVSETWTHRLRLTGSRAHRMLRAAARTVADPLTKSLFLAAYQASDAAYWRRHASEYEWRSLGGIIEYSPEFLALPGKQTSPDYLIAIRAAPNIDLKRAVIKVKAKKAGVIHQLEIAQDHFYGIPVRKALTAIPLKPRSSKGADWHELGDIYIKLSKAVDSDGVDLINGKKIADIFPSTSSNAASHRYAVRWRQYWNIGWIHTEMEEIKTRYYRELVQSARKLGRPLTMRRTAYRLLTSRLGLALTFWFHNLWSAQRIRTAISRAETAHRPVRSATARTAPTSRNTARCNAPTGVRP